ncbi:hypothetical protein [Burkholderia cenocepacia]|uniref:hypothetical protein n=1 Tax=Burkholderia cenocepacia TaxID=95486 RepID=UPI002AB63DCE|nr:hypothetical protein [Burkholderia cenocepacia]
MGYALFPLVVLMFFGGLIAQSQGLALSVVGAGSVGFAETRANVTAERVIAFADACMETAVTNPGLTGDAIAARLPIGAVAPAGAACKIDAVAGGGRVVYASAPLVPGAVSRIRELSEGSDTWFAISNATGVATSITSGDPHPIPTSLPSGNLLFQAQIRP